MAWRESPELIVESGIIKGYQCTQCTAYNDILTRACWNCSTKRLEKYEVFEAAVIWNRGLVGLMTMPTNEEARELHAKFFHRERIFVKDMDNVALREHRLELQAIAFEARSRLTAIDAEERERDANGKRDKNWLVSTGNDPNVTDAIEAVKERKARMSKADKMAEQFKNLGLPAEQVAALMANIAKTTEPAVTSSSTRVLKQPAFNSNIAGTTHNTKESLLGDISQSLVAGINDRPVNDLVSAAVTAGHLANKILNDSQVAQLPAKDIEPETTNSEPFDPSKLFS